MNMLPPQMGHNGGPPLNGVNVHLPQKFLQLFKPARHKAFYGGRGSAKSHSIATALVIISAKVKKRIVCARQFQNSIKDSSKELIETKISELGLSAQFTITEREIIHKTTGSRFTFIGLDRNPDSVKSLEGADICWIEEARTINKRSMEILIPTIRKPGSELWWSWNPEYETDEVDKYFRGATPPPNTILQFVGIEDNPWFYQTALPGEMEHMKRGNFARYQHVWLGGYDNDYESKIFSNVKIGRVNIPEYAAPRYGMDFGFGGDPSFITKTYVLEATKQIYIAREAQGRVPLEQLPAMMRSVIESDDDLIKADSSQPQTIDFLQGKGFNIYGAKKGGGSVKSGILFLQGYEIVIDPDCEHMRDEARLYSWQIDRLTKKRLSQPVDANNHGWDSIRYGVEDIMLGMDSSSDDSDGGVIRVGW